MWVTRRRGILKRKRSIHAGNIVTPGVLWVIHISASGHEKSEEFCFTEDEPALQGSNRINSLIQKDPATYDKAALCSPKELMAGCSPPEAGEGTLPCNAA